MSYDNVKRHRHRNPIKDRPLRITIPISYYVDKAMIKEKYDLFTLMQSALNYIFSFIIYL